MLLRPIYQCSIPNLLGCIRGLKIGGGVIDMRRSTTHTYRPSDPNLVRSGCGVECGMLNCRNGGHCSVAWHNSENVSCDCSRTSYIGSDCTVDEGLVFDANGYLSFELGRFLSNHILIQQKDTQTLQFAFVPKSPSTTHQVLASILFNDKRMLEVVLNKNGSINVAIMDNNKRVIVKTFVGNFSDGYRHLFVARFHKYQATIVTVDGIRHDFYFTNENLNLYNAIEVTLGGQGVEENDSLAIRMKTNYYGCITNLDLDFGIADFHVTPISSIYNTSYSLANYTHLIPPDVAQKRKCAPFKKRVLLPVFHESVELPVWETNFKRLIYRGDTMELYVKEEIEPWIWLAGFLIILMIALLIIIIIFCYWLKRDKTNEKSIIPVEEEQPLQMLQTHATLDEPQHLSDVNQDTEKTTAKLICSSSAPATSSTIVADAESATSAAHI